ncbi:MAG: hypothetical protein WC944_10370, partial [Candidatus Cloacimonadaceae bacterium]
GIPYLWRKLDCRRLACRARDVLIFKALGLAGCETHPIQQAGHFSGVQQISSTNQAFIVGGENRLSVQINSS